MFGKKSKLTGVPASEKAAQVHSPRLKTHGLKPSFERLGLAKQLPPALLAGKGSRESGLGTLLVSSRIYWGWGDKGHEPAKKAKLITASEFCKLTAFRRAYLKSSRN